MLTTDTRSITHCLPNVMYFQNVKNIKEIQQKAMKGDLPCTFLNPNLVVHPFQILVAAQYAIDAYLSNQMKTRNVYIEILYNLSPSKKITEALKMFGLNEQLNDILCVTLSSEFAKDIKIQVDGQMMDLDKLSNDSQKICTIMKLYGITEGELHTANIVETLVNRISAKTVNRT